MAYRRAAGEGQVNWSNAHNVYVAVLPVGKHPVTGKLITKTRYARIKGKTRAAYRDAEDMLDQLKEELEAEAAAEAQAADPRNYKLWDAIVDWHEWVPSQPRTSQQTADKLMLQARKWIYPRIGDMSIFDVDVAVLMEFFEGIAPDLGKSSLSDLKGTINRAIGYAIRRSRDTGFTGPNPVTLITEMPEAGHAPKDKDFLSQETVEAVLKAAEGTRMYALVTLGFMLGLRPGEIRALKWGRDGVDLDNGVVSVLKAARKGGDGKTKTQASRRALKIPARLMEALRWHRQEFGEHEYVFTREDGRQHDKDGIGWRFSKLMRDAGYRDIEDPYVMRHTFASVCYHNDMPVKKISLMMGHANEAVTLRVYIHLFKPEVTDTDGLDDIWGTAS